MTSNQATSTIQVEIEHLLYYRKSKIGLFVGTLVEPLMSHGEIFVDAGKECKIKIKFDCIDLQKLRSARVLEFVIRNSCEEKFYTRPVRDLTTTLSFNEKGHMPTFLKKLSTPLIIHYM